MSTLFQRLNEDLADVAEKAGRSLVHISNGGRGAGAGTIWHPDGLILTNAHVVGKRALTVTLSDGRVLPARVLARDTSRDIAALSVDATGLPSIELGESKQLQPGQVVLALGHPFGIVGAVTTGIVIGNGSSSPEMRDSGREWVMVSLNLRPGNSGGPLVDVDGRLVGINTIMTGPQAGMAVPVHVAKAFLNETLHSQQAAS